jgi:hypothetical protein
MIKERSAIKTTRLTTTKILMMSDINTTRLTTAKILMILVYIKILLPGQDHIII